MASRSQHVAGESEEKLKRLGGVFARFSVLDRVLAGFPLAGGF